MRKLNLIFQEILKFVFVFLFAFVWIRYYIKKLWLACIYSVLVAFSVYLILLLIKRKRNDKLGLKLKEKIDAENMFLSLTCSTNAITFFEKLAKSRHENVVKHKEYLVINHEKEQVKTILFPYLNFEELNTSNFMKIYTKIKKEKATKVVISCKEVAKNTVIFSQNFTEKFIFLNEYETYQKLYKLYDFYPEITHKYNAEKKLAFKDFIAHSFNKKRTKGYLLSAFILVFCSLFVYSSLYYCIWASILIVFAIISQFNPRFNHKPEVEIL